MFLKIGKGVTRYEKRGKNPLIPLNYEVEGNDSHECGLNLKTPNYFGVFLSLRGLARCLVWRACPPSFGRVGLLQRSPFGRTNIPLVNILSLKQKNPTFQLGFLSAPRVGLEPTTLRLTAACSAIELPRNQNLDCKNMP